MGLIIILPFLALASWSIFAIFRWLRRGNFEPKWWKAYYIHATVGLLLGIWFAFFFKYHMPTARLESFPIPTHFSRLDKTQKPERWEESDIPAYIRVTAQVTNVLCGVALCLAPIAIAAFFKENKIQRDEHGKPIIPGKA